MIKNTKNNSEIEKFSKIAKEWWDPAGKFKPLHKFNPCRIDYIRKKIINHFAIISDNLKCLNNLNIIDVGAHHGETLNYIIKNFKVQKLLCYEASKKNF